MICSKEKCTGCFACYNICPKNAIDMIEDDNGFIYPYINKKKCIGCNMCKNVCPSIKFIKKSNPHSCYAAISKKNKTRSLSTSGGIATELSYLFLKEGGIVYGAAFSDDCTVNHIRIDSLEDLKYLQGSKYTHSYINDKFKLIKKDLFNNRKVLFIGTPCQIAGLKSYLHKDFENLLLVDIICHGVPSQKYLKDEVFREVGNNDVDSIKFRIGNEYTFCILKKNTIVSCDNVRKSPYINAFLSGISVRSNCHNCLYAGSQRVSDITLGDYWGLPNESNFYKEREKGVSVVIINSVKGEKYFDFLKKYIYFEIREINEAITGNTQLQRPLNNKAEADLFKKIYIKKGFYKAYNRMKYYRKLKSLLRKLGIYRK